MKKWLDQYVFNRKWMCRYICILFILSLLPLVLIGLYNHPSADDYVNGSHTVGVWEETGSLGQALSAAAEGTAGFYNSWQGNFSALFLIMLWPVVFGEGFYFLISIFLILGFAAASIFLLKVILTDYLGMDKYSCGIVSMLMTSMQFLILPVEAFYWCSGAAFYTGFYALALLTFALVLVAAKTQKKLAHIICAIAVFVLSFLIGGSNFVVALTASLVMALILAYRLIFKRGKWLVPLLGLIAMCGALLISASAPGNAVRQEHFQGMNPIESIVMSLWYGFRFAVGVFPLPGGLDTVPLPVYFAFAALVPLIYNNLRGSNFDFRMPGVATALFYGVYASTFTPNFYAMSSTGPLRVANVNYYVFLLFLLFTIVYWCGWSAKRAARAAPRSIAQKRSAKRKSDAGRVCASLLAAGFIVGCVVITGSDINAIAGVSAANSLANGEAKIYHEEYLARIALYTNPNIKEVEVSPFTGIPYVLVFTDVTTDISDNRNASIANYYDKDWVVLKHDAP